jgi:hypothetical protein
LTGFRQDFLDRRTGFAGGTGGGEAEKDKGFF